MNYFRFLLLAVLTVLMGGQSTHAQTYSLSDLGAVSEAEESVAFDINTDGSVVGVSGTYVERESKFDWGLDYDGGVLWRPMGDLSNPSYTAETTTLDSLYAVNDNGKAVGAETTTAFGAGHISFHEKPYIYQAGTTDSMSALTQYGKPVDINNTGQVVGDSYLSHGTNRAFLLNTNSNDTAVDLGLLNGYDDSYARSINNRGKVVGYAARDTGVDHAFLHNGSKMMDMGDLPGGLNLSHANSINDNGRVVGQGHDEEGAKAFFWAGDTSDVSSGPGEMIGLGTLSGDDASNALDINNNNHIVGYSSSGEEKRAARWGANGSIQDLNSLVDESAEGWTLQQANAVNDAGQIVGLGRYNDKKRAFALTPVDSERTPPEESSALLLRSRLSSLADADGNADNLNQIHDSLPDGLTGRRNLVLIAHGWNSSPNAWAHDLADDIANRLGNQRDQWDIVAVDWEGAAGNIVGEGFEDAKLNASLIGASVGTGIDIRGYNKVHMIGHSAGSWLIDTAADKAKALAEDSNRSLNIQATFLDAYTPFGEGSKELGDTADWAEQYVDGAWGLEEARGGLTNTTLDKAYNFDVTNIEGRGVRGVIPAHQWPYQWYNDTAGGRYYPNPEKAGFFKSIVEGTPDYSKFSKGERWYFGTQTPLEQIVRNVAASTKKSFSEAVDRVFSDTGTTQIVGPYAAVSETGSPVWMMSEFDVDHSFNFLGFDYEFLSDEDAEGWLSIYFDGELVYEADERFDLEGLNSESLWLGEEYEAGSYWFSYRLNPFSDVPSKVEVSNLRFSLVQQELRGAEVVPLPSGGWAGLLGFVVLGGAYLLRRPRVQQDHRTA